MKSDHTGGLKINEVCCQHQHFGALFAAAEFFIQSRAGINLGIIAAESGAGGVSRTKPSSFD